MRWHKNENERNASEEQIVFFENVTSGIGSAIHLERSVRNDVILEHVAGRLAPAGAVSVYPACHRYAIAWRTRNSVVSDEIVPSRAHGDTGNVLQDEPDVLDNVELNTTVVWKQPCSRWSRH